MPSLKERLGFIRSNASTRAVILQEALVHALPDELGTMLAALRSTGSESGLLIAIRRLHEVPPDERLVVVRGAHLHTVTTDIIRRHDPQAIANLLEAIRLTADARALPGITSILRDASQELAIDTGRTLLHVTLDHLGTLGRRPCPTDIEDALDITLAQALDDYREHRLDDVLMAAAWMAGRAGPRLSTILNDPQHEAVFAIRSVPERLYQGPVRKSLINWLSVDALSGPVGRWLSRVEGAAAWDDVLATGHLLRNPSRRRGLRRADRPMQCLPSIDACVQLSPVSQTALPDLIVSLDLTSRTRANRLGDLIALDDPIARLGVIDKLIATDDDLTTWLTPFVRDRSPFVSRVASIALTRATERDAIPLAQTLTAAERSGHPSVSAHARRRAATFGLDAYFARWLGLPFPTRIAVARRLMDHQPRQICQRLADLIRTGTRDERLAGITLARRLDIAGPVGKALVAAAVGRDVHVASAAISALAGQTSEPVIDALVSGLTHNDARVRANAIESLGAGIDDEIIDRIADHTLSSDNRPRANAVRTVLRLRPMLGLTELRDMLTDHRPMHRVSALWVAQHARDRRVLDDVRRLEVDEPIANVRTRASVARRFLEAGLPNATTNAMTSSSGGLSS